jgi:hypothetical protein
MALGGLQTSITKLDRSNSMFGISKMRIGFGALIGKSAAPYVARFKSRKQLSLGGGF